MKFLTTESGAAKRLFWSLCGGVTVFIFLSSAQNDLVLTTASAVLIMFGLFPMYIWMLGDGRGLPIWPCFAGYTCISAALPVIQAALSVQAYSSEAIFTGLGTVGLFVLLGTVVWVSFTARAPQPPRTVLMLASASVVRSLFICLGIGLVFNANALAGWFIFPGNSMQVARGIAGGLGFLGTFALAFFHGSNQLSRYQIVVYSVMVVLTALFSLTGLMLANAVPTVTLAVIGYTLGSGRVPWKALAAIFVVTAILHPGKFSMRAIYDENPGKKAAIGILSLPSFYSEWVSYGLESLGGMTGVIQSAAAKEEGAASTVFDRAGTLHMLLLVQQKSPNEVPFLNGLTYEPIPYLLIPRFLAPDKGVSHAGNIMLSMNYGLQDLEATRTTSIGWNLVAEAYANFGFAGVIIMGLLLGGLYASVSRLTVGVPITSFRFVSGLIVLAGVTNDNSFGVFITMQFQAVVGVALASFFLMKREPNPIFAVEEQEAREQRRIGLTYEWMRGRDFEETESRSGQAEAIAAWAQAASPNNGSGHGHTGRLGGDGPAACGPRLAADGAVVRAAPAKTPRRMAAWMPRRMRNQVLVAQSAADADSMRHEASGDGGGKSSRDEETTRAETPKRPRQLAVPYQNYRRYRG